MMLVIESPSVSSASVSEKCCARLVVLVRSNPVWQLRGTIINCVEHVARRLILTPQCRVSRVSLHEI